MTKTVALLPELVERVARAIANACDVDPDVFIGMHGRRVWERQWHPQAIAAIEATRTQTDQPKLERLEAKWLKWPDGDAGDAIDFACDHCAPDEALAFMNDWREGMAGEWPGYVSWLKTQRDGARANLNAEEPSE